MSATEAQGTFACPICGKDTPHYHSPVEVAEHRDTEAWVEESLAKFHETHAATLASRMTAPAWPRHPDGSNKRVREMTPTERAAVCAAASERTSPARTK